LVDDVLQGGAKRNQQRVEMRKRRRRPKERNKNLFR